MLYKCTANFTNGLGSYKHTAIIETTEATKHGDFLVEMLGNELLGAILFEMGVDVHEEIHFEIDYADYTPIGEDMFMAEIGAPMFSFMEGAE